MAMSGGVDSSVSALVLRDEGYDVTGVTLKLFHAESDFAPASPVGSAGPVLEQSAPDGSNTAATALGSGLAAPGPTAAPAAPTSQPPAGKVCCSADDAEDARQVCLTLGLEHFTYNFTRTFEADVIDRFCDGYLRGETPNPCIDCNRYVKFAALQRRRAELGFDYVATGHYARREYNERTGRYELKRGLDANKDQSYVLFHLTQETLAHMLFPLGALTKPQVRELAERHGFINAHKAESQDICFVPDGDYASYIQRRRSVRFEPGAIVSRDGKVLGRHNGLVHYTIGQRKGIGVAAPEPLYVFAKDVQRNELVVDTSARAVCTSVEVRDVNFIARASLERPEQFLAKTHYRQQPRPATVEQTDTDRIRLTFPEPQRACAPGQAAVVYDGDSVVCGGTIVGCA